MSSFCDSRRAPRNRDGYEGEFRYHDRPDPRMRGYDCMPMNGQGPCDNISEKMFDRKERFRDDHMRDYGDMHLRTEEESDEEGEVKEAGSTRDLREEIEAKRVRRQGSRMIITMQNRDENMMKMRGPPMGYFEGNPAGRRDAGMDDPPDMNGMPMIRRDERRREMGPRPNGPMHGDMPRSNGPPMDFRKGFPMDDGDIGAFRRRPSSPDMFRPRDMGPMMRGMSPGRRLSSPLRRSLGRRSLGRSASPPGRRMPGVFHLEHRPGDGRHFRALSREPREHEFREMQSPARFCPMPGPGYMRDVPSLPVSRSNCIHVRNLPHGLPIDRLKADLFDDCMRHGRVLDLAIEFRGNERHAFVTFAEPGMAEDARRQLHRTLFHGSPIDVEMDFPAPAPPAEVRRKFDDRESGPAMNNNNNEIAGMIPFQQEMDDPCSNCRVLVDDIDDRLPDAEIHNTFKQFGAMETFEVLRDAQQRGGKVSAIIRFRTLSSAVRARREMSGQRLGERRCRIDYRFGDPTCELWIGGVHMSVTEADVNREFSRFGRICKVQINRANKCAFVLFDRVEDAVEAAAHMRGRVLGSAAWKLKVDFADRSLIRAHSPGRQFGRFLKGGGGGGGASSNNNPRVADRVGESRGAESQGEMEAVSGDASSSNHRTQQGSGGGGSSSVQSDERGEKTASASTMNAGNSNSSSGAAATVGGGAPAAVAAVGAKRSRDSSNWGDAVVVQPLEKRPSSLTTTTTTTTTTTAMATDHGTVSIPSSASSSSGAASSASGDRHPSTDSSDAAVVQTAAERKTSSLSSTTADAAPAAAATSERCSADGGDMAVDGRISSTTTSVTDGSGSSVAAPPAAAAASGCASLEVPARRPSEQLSARRHMAEAPAPVAINGHLSFEDTAAAAAARRRSSSTVMDLDATTPGAAQLVNPSPTAVAAAAAAAAEAPATAPTTAAAGDNAEPAGPAAAAGGEAGAAAGGEAGGIGKDPVERFPVLWRGQAVVKGAAAAVVLRSLTCDAALAGALLTGDKVTMTQRMRLGEDQMKEFGARLAATAAAARGVLLAVPASAEDGARLQRHFVAYLVERNAAGVVQLDAGMLYLFPPGSDLANEYQKSADIDLSLHAAYLLVVLLQDPPPPS